MHPHRKKEAVMRKNCNIFSRISFLFVLLTSLCLCQADAKSSDKVCEKKPGTMPVYHPSFRGKKMFHQAKGKSKIDPEELFGEGYVSIEAGYILACQYIEEGDPASGAINAPPAAPMTSSSSIL